MVTTGKVSLSLLTSAATRYREMNGEWCGRAGSGWLGSWGAGESGGGPPHSGTLRAGWRVRERQCWRVCRVAAGHRPALRARGVASFSLSLL